MADTDLTKESLPAFEPWPVDHEVDGPDKRYVIRKVGDGWVNEEQEFCTACGGEVIYSFGAFIHDGTTPSPNDPHDCDRFMVPYDERGQPGAGPLGHGWNCGVCGRFLQAG